MIKSKKIKVLIISILCILAITIGLSYGYYLLNKIQENNNIAGSKCFNLEFTNEKNAISLDNMYPISDEEGRKLTPYSFTITNTCDMLAGYTVNMEMLEGTTLNSKYLASLVNNGDIKLLSSYDTAKTTISGSVESRTLDTNILTPGASKEYSISLWMDKSVTLADDAQNKILSAKVVIDASMYTGIVDKIVAQLDMTGKCPTVNEDGSITAPTGETTNGYLCSAPDAYGTSYYYRGAVDNNYIKFGVYNHDIYFGYASSSSPNYIDYKIYNSLEECQNATSFNNNCGIGIKNGTLMYWRIVRINGDGSMRIIYDGTVTHANGEFSSDRYIGNTEFNNASGDNAYVGYMYGKVGASTYVETHANTNDSTIKKYLDNWYEKNIKNTEYEQYLADNLFCNYRSINSGTGAGKDNTNYRWNSTGKILLTCPQKNDAFTVSDTTNGNGSLKYPIGLLTADEFWLAGGSGSSNNKFYLYTGNSEWLLSPQKFTGSSAYERRLYNGYLANSHVDGNNDFFGNHDYTGTRVVLNLKFGLLLQGTGTMEDPFVVG